MDCPQSPDDASLMATLPAFVCPRSKQTSVENEIKSGADQLLHVSSKANDSSDKGHQTLTHVQKALSLQERLELSEGIKQVAFSCKADRRIALLFA
jgi:hypothetical protein